MSATVPSRRTRKRRRQARRGGPPSADRLAAVNRLLDDAIAGGLELRADREHVLQALLRAFVLHPVGSKMAALIGAALNDQVPDRDRPDDHLAVRELLADGQVPNPEAIAGAIQRAQQRQARRDRIEQARRARAEERLDAIAAHDGAQVAAEVIHYWRRTSHAPSLGYLRQKMGWRKSDAEALAGRLAEAGWLVLDGDQTPQPGVRGAGVTP